MARLELSSEGAGGGGDAFITAVAEDGRRLLAKAAVVAVPLPMLVSNDGAAGAEGVLLVTFTDVGGLQVARQFHLTELFLL